MHKPLAEACLRNQEPISQVIAELFPIPAEILEIGSGTGQHAVYIARALPHLTWQPTELEENLAGIELWRSDADLPNVLPPQVLDARHGPWPEASCFDGVFTANTVHFVGWPVVRALFAGAAVVLKANGLFCVYGPFNYNGQYTSEGNRSLDGWLNSRDPESGIKDFQAVVDLAQSFGLQFLTDIPMPANNRILVFQKTAI